MQLLAAGYRFLLAAPDAAASTTIVRPTFSRVLSITIGLAGAEVSKVCRSLEGCYHAMRNTITAAVVLVFLIPIGVKGQSDPVTWNHCKAFQATEPCKIQIPVIKNPVNNKPSLQPQPDVMVKPGGSAPIKAAAVLTNASPFISCTLAATPSPLTRDVGASFATFLTTLGTAGLAFAAQGAPSVSPALHDDPDVIALTRLLESINANLEEAQKRIDDDVAMYNAANDKIQEDWLYRYDSESDFSSKAGELYIVLRSLLNARLPNTANIQFQITTLNNIISRIYLKYGGSQDQNVMVWLQLVSDTIAKDTDRASTLQTRVTNFSSALTQVRQYYDFLTSISDKDHPGQFTTGSHITIVLPMANFVNKQVSEAITCQDVIAQKPVFDTLTFTAYYENSPWWDLSAGAVISLLGGRQVGPVSGPLSQGAAPTVLAVTSSSSVQFIPAAFFELHPGPMNFSCPWGSKNVPHSARNTCSFGLSLGLLINPNNGTTGAEYFEGVSFAIQRVSFSIGNHTGKHQEFGNGYTVGETVPAGTTPPTVRKWTNRPAFGITYRIPLR